MIEAVADGMTSADGTAIACWRSGQGRPLVLVHGTTADHTRWGTVLPLLEDHAEVWAVDRRGRGASGDAPGYAIEREFDDVAAVVDATGGPVDLLGHSFGAICALEAARLTPNLRRLVLYEPPIDSGRVRPDLVEHLDDLLARGRREDVVATFFREVVGMPEAQLEAFRSLPAWPARIAAAHTLARELQAADAYRLDPRRCAHVTVPTLLLLGGDSSAPARTATEALAAALPDSRIAVLDGQQHVAMDTAPERFADEVVAFLGEA